MRRNAGTLGGDIATASPAAGPQEFLKIGTRNAMVISVASLALVVETQLRVGDRQGRPSGAALRERR